MKGLDLIVVNYRTPDMLDRFAKSFAKIRGENCKIPISAYLVNVDPTAEDAARGRATLEMFPDVPLYYISTETNVGYAGACNFAASFGEKEVIGFFNADVWFPNDSVLDGCCKALMENPEWGVLGPMQVNEDNKLTHAGIFGTLEVPQHRGWHERYNPAYRDIKSAVTVSGSAYFTKREVWNRMHECETYRSLYPTVKGAFLPTPHYYEETWYSYHVQDHGLKVMYYGPEMLGHSWHKASPVGGHADSKMPESQAMFREMCDLHRIPHD